MVTALLVHNTYRLTMQEVMCKLHQKRKAVLEGVSTNVSLSEVRDAHISCAKNGPKELYVEERPIGNDVALVVLSQTESQRTTKYSA